MTIYVKKTIRFKELLYEMIMIIQHETLFCNNDIVRGYKNLTWCAFSLLTTLIHKSASNETSYYMHNTSVIADYNNKRTRTIRFDKILKHNVQYIHKYIRCSNIEDNLILSPYLNSFSM